jgi:putative nucleotidyltransferase with HDIG domain
MSFYIVFTQLDSSLQGARGFFLKGLHINKEIETVHLNGLEVTLLAASNDGTEIIRHRIEKGHRWALYPQEGWTALEFIQLIKGKMSLDSSHKEEMTLTSGDFFYGSPIQDFAIFFADEETEFLYVSSQPVFHSYSLEVKQLMDLVIGVEEKDGYTANHCKRITDICMKLGKKFDFAPYDLKLLNHAAFFHDIGKMRVPNSILNKPSKLSNEEWEIIKTHCSHGRAILEETKNPILRNAGKIVEQHHERYDGKGYPFGLKEEEIDLKAAIISVVDSFDAMTVDRVYQKARSVDEAIKELNRCKGTMYHPLVVDTFLSIIEEGEITK